MRPSGSDLFLYKRGKKSKANERERERETRALKREERTSADSRRAHLYFREERTRTSEDTQEQPHSLSLFPARETELFPGAGGRDARALERAPGSLFLPLSFERRFASRGLQRPDKGPTRTMEESPQEPRTALCRERALKLALSRVRLTPLCAFGISAEFSDSNETLGR